MPTRLRLAYQRQNPSDLVGWAVFAVVSLGLVVALLVTVLVPVDARRTTIAPFDLAALEGGTRVQSASLEGEPTVLWFWAPWCPYSRAVADDIAAVAARQGSRVNFVGIGGDGQVAEMHQFLDDTGVHGIVHGIDADGSMWETFDITSVPTFAFVHADGEVDWYEGAMDRDQIEDKVAALTS